MGREIAENLCLGFGCRGKGFFAKVSGCLRSIPFISAIVIRTGIVSLYLAAPQSRKSSLHFKTKVQAAFSLLKPVLWSFRFAV